jgi:hypothetical protein
MEKAILAIASALRGFCRPLRFMKTFLFQNKLLFMGIMLGAVAGFLYWKFGGLQQRYLYDHFKMA